MASISRFLAHTLKLTVNATKSAVARASERQFLGYRLSWHQTPKLWIAPRVRETSWKGGKSSMRKMLAAATMTTTF